jgi:signal peptidase II
VDPRPDEPVADQRDDASASTGADGAAPAKTGRLRLVLVVAAVVLLLDLATKLVVVAQLEGETPIRVLGDWLVLRVIRNPGAAFSIGTGMTLLLTAVATVVVVFVVRQARRLRSTLWALTLGALLGGALGNLVDRVFRSPGVFRGHVVDWVAVKDFPVFNVADSAITLTAVAIVLLTLRGVPLEGPSAGAAVDPGPVDPDPVDPPPVDPAPVDPAPVDLLEPPAPLPRDRSDGPDHG